MIQKADISDRRLLRYSFLIYIILWLAELAAKAFSVLGRFSSGKVTSSLVGKMKDGLILLRVELAIYIIILIAIYAFFAFINWRYSILASAWLQRYRPNSLVASKGAAFLVVQGTFLIILYGLNACLYPSSSLVLIPETSRNLLFLNNATPFFIVALAVYFIGFIFLNLRRRQSLAGYVALACLIFIAGASCDPAYQIHQKFSQKRLSGNRGPNVIIIGLDSLNPQHTGFFGYPLATTPRLDAFLKENIVFEQCYTPIARTFPAWYSILTGQYPKTSGVRFNLIKRKYIKSEAFTLGNILRRRGYYAAHFTDEVRFSNVMPEDGFDELTHPPMGIRDFVFGSFHDFSLTNVLFNSPLGFIFFPVLKHNRAVAHLYDGRYFVNNIVTSLDRLSGHDQFFMALHLCIAHWPYDHASPRPLPFDPRVDPQMELYDSALSRLDALFGRIIEAIKKRGLYDNSIIIVLSDHGESSEGHGNDLRDTAQNRVLLAWKPIGPIMPRRVKSLVRTIDIAPTVLESLQIKDDRDSCDGQSLNAYFAGHETVTANDEKYVFVETEFSLETPQGIVTDIQKIVEEGVQFYEFDNRGLITMRDKFHDLLITRRHRAVMSQDWKLVLEMNAKGSRFLPEKRLIDMRLDPQGRNNAIVDRPDIADRFMMLLKKQYGDEIAAFR